MMSHGFQRFLVSSFSMLVFLVICLASADALAQQEKVVPKRDDSAKPAATSERASSNASGTSSVLVTPEEDYRMGSNDVIEVAIEDAPELSGSFRITAAGTFLMPYLGRVTAKGQTT